MRPRALLLSSLCLWSVLLASAPRLGMNKTVSFTVYSSSIDGSFDDASCPMAAPPASPPSDDTATSTTTNEEESAGLTSTAWVDVSESAMAARVLAADNDEVMDSEWEFSEDTLESMTAQQRESLSALRDFWDAMEEVVGDPQEAEEIREEYEEQLDEQLRAMDDEKEEPAMVITQEELVQGMEEKMMDARDRANLDDEAILELLQTATSNQKRFGDEDDDEINESFSSSSDLDSDSDSDSDESKSEKGKPTHKSLSSCKKNKSRTTASMIIPRAANRLLLAMALVANFWVVHSEYWDLPALLFVGLGSTAVLLAHAWVPHL
ncbi:hypothetical protein BGZ97_004338 [Linnemannia gamsii]|uniref:Transmembrane protein n=1 Tax=Linnemannia gamsii TaxID=64522 RepID=A0A9P6USU4_9FUNG|nr:hypothetical protein BGZ97_004338 [Linnemannia gamsii]